MSLLVVPPEPGMLSPDQHILIDICCAPDAVYVFRILKNSVRITGFFDNPNIHPKDEYDKRRNETIKVCKFLDVPLIEGAYDPQEWFNAVKGFEEEPEGGKRCEICFRYRMQKAAAETVIRKLDGFTTVLTVSPHKNADLINRLGQEIAAEFGVRYIPSNFKKKEGFKRSAALSDELGLYRQNYCGCMFSMP